MIRSFLWTAFPETGWRVVIDVPGVRFERTHPTLGAARGWLRRSLETLYAVICQSCGSRLVSEIDGVVCLSCGERLVQKSRAAVRGVKPALQLGSLPTATASVAAQNQSP